MSTKLAEVLKQVENLSVDELLTLQEQVTRYLRVKSHASAIQTNSRANRRITIPGAYQPTPEEIEASLAATFTPEEMAEMDKVDLDNLPTGSKTLSELIIEDREDRF